MSNLAKLKKKATDLEHKKQLEKAIPLYQQVVAEQGDGEDADVGLVNRLGDLLHKGGRVNEAVAYWEQAADMYSTRGFLNNSIAICNKVLRASPASVAVYHKLGRMHAQKGFRNDARQHFLEYADRMQRLGQMDEAFSALKEFADLCPDHEDIRHSLADQLARHDRVPEALQQLDILYARYRRLGNSGEAEATRERMLQLDSSYEPRAVSQPDAAEDLLMMQGGRSAPVASRNAADDLVLIGPDAGARRTNPHPVAGIEFGGEFQPPADRDPAREDLDDDALPPSALDAVEDDDYDPAALGNRPVDAASLDGFETTSLEVSDDAFASTGLISPAGTTAQLADDDDVSFELPPLATIEQSIDAEVHSRDSLELSGLELPDVEDVRSHRAEDGDAAAELAAEASRRGHQPDVMDALGARPESTGPEAADDDDLISFELPDVVEANDLPSPTSASPASDSVDSGFDLIELPPMDSHELVIDDSATASTDTHDIWNAPPAAARGEQIPSWRRVSASLVAEGDTEAALAELETALGSFESTGDLVAAGEVIDEIIRVEPTVAQHRRRVELAFRGGDRVRLRLAYEGLAGALDGKGEAAEAASVRARIAELDGTARVDSAPAGPPPAVFGDLVSPAAAPAVSDALAEFINLGDLLREDEPERTTRMVVEEQAPSGDEQADFAEMLAKFKQGLAENVDAEDYESHHDLGVAFREMGLLDEAILEFQKALRGTGRRIRSFEALGECFVEKEQYQLAVATLTRATQETSEEDDQLVGVWYWLGVAQDAMGQREEAVKLFERVLAVDYGFRDAADRVAGNARAVT